MERNKIEYFNCSKFLNVDVSRMLQKLASSKIGSHSNLELTNFSFERLPKMESNNTNLDFKNLNQRIRWMLLGLSVSFIDQERKEGI